MGDMKDKFKGFMKKMNNQITTSSSGKFKGQGRTLGSSSSGPTNSTPARPSSGAPYVNPNLNPKPKPNPTAVASSTAVVDSRPLPQKTSSSSSDTPLNRPSVVEDHKPQNANLNANPTLDQPRGDGFDPFDSLITTGARNKNGYSLNVFECPVCNCGFASEDEVSLHIESCIGNPSDNAGGDGGCGSGSVDDGGKEVEYRNKVEACVGSYLSASPTEGSVEILLRLLRNVVKEPENPKFRKVRMGNPKIREAVGEVAGGLELLECVGFELKEEDGEMWAVMDTPSEENIILLNEAARVLEPKKNVSSVASEKLEEKVEPEKVKPREPEVIDRQIKVFFSVPESVAARIELPESFYNLSLDEVRREAEMRKKKMADSQLLIPKSFKEKQAQALKRRYKRAIIRVQFPDGVVLQGVFSPREPTSALYEFVSSALKQQGLEFELIHPIPVKRRVIPCFPKAGERASALEDEDLVPSALVKCKPFETDSMVFTGLKNELLEISEPL